MQNLYTNKTIAIGLEPEFIGASPNQMNSFNQGSNLIDGLSYKSDPSVGTEADVPVLADCEFTRDYVTKIYNQIRKRARESLWACFESLFKIKVYDSTFFFFA